MKIHPIFFLVLLSVSPISAEELRLKVSKYAISKDSLMFRWPTHIAFGPDDKEIITDLKNNRFLYRESPDNPLKISPIPVNGPHSVAYNPADKLYYANDTENNRLIAFADPSKKTISAETNTINGVPLKRPHDVVIDPATGWIYAINPNSGHVFRFTAIGENESVIKVPLEGYARALTFANGKLYAIGSSKGRIVEIVDWDTPKFKIYDSFDPTNKRGPAGTWSKTGLVLNDAEYFNGYWYATSYFTKSFAAGSDFDKNKFVQFKTLDDFVAGKWTDLSNLIPSGITPYYLTVNQNKLHLAVFNHESPGNGDAILQFTQPNSLAAAKEDDVPQNTNALWAGYDPRAEALDVKVIKEWDETYQNQKLKIQMLTYTVGTFKGEVSRISAYYAYPIDAKAKIPGLVQVHGGGQRADRKTVTADAANGYASISINWGGRELADQKQDEPGTDWGAIDPTQKHVSHYFKLTPDDKTAETVYSPRNNNWFILTLATRRALTFLEQQPVVDAEQLGVYGHSMGGTITGQVAAIDPRIKASVPSCGGAGISQAKNIARPGSSLDQRVKDKLYSTTIDSTASLGNLKYPILGQSPQNDFNCIYDDLNHNWQVIDKSLVHFSISPHLNHRHIDQSAFTRIRFFNAFLKSEEPFPTRPKLTVDLKTSDGTPTATVNPDTIDKVQKVQVYYSINPHSLTRFWRRAETIRKGDHWQARLPIISSSMPLFVMANVEYSQPRPLIGPPHIPNSPPTYLVSSWEKIIDPADLQAANVKPTDRPNRIIQPNFDNWADWFQISWPNTDHAHAGTRKLTDPKWRGPDGANLTIDIKDPAGGNFLMTFSVNQWRAYPGLEAAEYYCVKPLTKTDGWQTISIALTDLKPRKTGTPPLPKSWQGITELGIVAGIHRLPDNQKSILSGGTWPGKRQLRNLRWTGGAYTSPLLYPGGRLSAEEFQKIFQDDINKSIQLENNDTKPAE